MAEAYINLAIRRQAILERLKSGEVKNFAAEIKKLEKLIRRTILELDEEFSNLSRTKLNNLLRLMQQDQGVLFKAATESFLARSADIAAVYMAQEVLDLNNTIDLSDTKLKDFTKKETFKRVIQRPLSTDGELLEPWLKNFTDRETARVSNAVRMGHSQGLTNQEMVQRLVGTKSRNFQDGILQTTRRNASTVVRTSVQHVASAARQEVWEANQDVVKRYQFLATLDRVTSRICRTLDKQEFDFGKGPIPPVHPNCLLPGTFITSSCGISRIYKRAYKGKIVTIKTGLGNTLTVTPNHPILSDNGWVGAQFLNVGDKCFIDSFSQGVVSTKGEDDAIYPTIEQVTEAFSTSFNVSSVEVPTTTPNFHGDSINNEVAHVFSHNDLGFVSYTPNVKHSSKRGFVMGNSSSAIFSTCDGSFIDSLITDNPTSCSGVGFFDQLLPIGEAGSVHPSLLLGTSTTESDPVFSQDSLDGSWADAEFLCNTTDTNALGVKVDYVVSVEISDFLGHVYNLETHDHLVKCNGVVTHNCRSTTIPVLDDKFSFLSKGRTRSAEQGPVSADTQFYDWLKRQNKDAQVAILGPKRAALFRDGGLSAERFRELQFDKNFAPLTLAEMQKIEPEAFKKAGL